MRGKTFTWVRNDPGGKKKKGKTAYIIKNSSKTSGVELLVEGIEKNVATDFFFKS